VKKTGVRLAHLFLACISALVLGCSGQESQEKTAEHSLREQSDSSRPFGLMSVGEREELRERLMREGRYECCVKPGCTECIGKRDSCGCYLDIRKDDPICGECFDGYKEGRGKLKLVSIVELEKIRKNAQEEKQSQ